MSYGRGTLQYLALSMEVQKRKRSVRRVDTSLARCIYLLRQYFERERAAGKSMNLYRVVDRVAEALDVAHPELNPIEMVWSTVKRAVADKNSEFRFKQVIELTKQELRKMTAQKWRAYEAHTRKVEDLYFKALEAENGSDSGDDLQ